MCPEVIHPAPEQQTPVDTFSKHAKIAVGLGVMAALSQRSVDLGVLNSAPDPIREIVESLKHPVLGHIGAAAGGALVSRESRTLRAVYMGIGVTVFNFSGEIIQSIIAPISPESDFLASNNAFETIKDYGFSFIGAGIFIFNAWRWQRKRATAPAFEETV